jgi:hypothetical protein
MAHKHVDAVSVQLLTAFNSLMHANIALCVSCCSDYARPCTPENPLSAFEIAQGTLPGDVAKDFANRMPSSEFLLPMNSVAGTCNSYLPNGISTLPRFLWVVEYLVANGMYVLVSALLNQCHMLCYKLHDETVSPRIRMSCLLANILCLYGVVCRRAAGAVLLETLSSA